MSAAMIQVPECPRLDAAEVLAQARSAAFPDLEPAAYLLVEALRLCFPTEAEAFAALGRACFLVVKQAEANEEAGIEAEPWPLPLPDLHGRLVASLGDGLKKDRSRCLGWACFRALRDGAGWLATAAKLEKRDGHEMRLPGGLRLAPTAFNGEQLRAQVMAVDPPSGVPGGEVLRITWEDNARRVVQSKPGRFGEVDCAAEPE